MGVEIERKFLVKSDAWRAGPAGILYRQGYLNRDKDRTVRVRVAGEKAWLTIKGRRDGLARAEFEYAIPLEEAQDLLELCQGPLIEKTRYLREYASFVWEVDEFHGDNDGLIIAEIELPAEDTAFAKPAWAGEDVSDDPRYFNSRLAQEPYRQWAKVASVEEA